MGKGNESKGMNKKEPRTEGKEGAERGMKEGGGRQRESEKSAHAATFTTDLPFPPTIT